MSDEEKFFKLLRLCLAKLALALSPVGFWLTWSACGIGAKYFYWLPVVFQRPSLFDCLCLFEIVAILHLLMPKIHLTVRQDRS